jgi:hypothetical protein
MDEDKIKDYLVEYDAFVTTFKNTQVSGEEVGALIARMTNHYTKINLMLAEALRAYSSCVATYQNSTDENTGKPMSSAKAETLAAATPEASAYNKLKAHVQNLEQIINSLKALQKGVMFEYSSAI